MNAFKELYQDRLTDKPIKIKSKGKTGRSKHLGWVFFTNELNHKPKSVRTYQSLFLATTQYKYFTPNSFFHSDSREQASLRWINAVSIDFDVKDTKGKIVTLPELFDLIESAGLPSPTLIVQTPSGGYHIHWYLKQARRCDRKNKIIRHYKRVLALMIEELGADLQANGPERFFRVPNSEGSPVVYQSNDRTDFSDLCDWYSIEVERRNQERFTCFINPGFNLFSHPAVNKLLKGVHKGIRDNACYTLALAYKSVGKSEEETEKKLQKWNLKNDPPLSFIQVRKKVQSAFKHGSPVGPSANFITKLSGIPFSYQVWQPKKDRTDRKYSHYDEWEQDVLAYIRKRNGAISGSQRMLAELICSSADPKKKIPYATFKIVTKRLIDSNKIVKIVEGKGRGAITTYYIQDQIQTQEQAAVSLDDENTNDFSINGLDSYTPIDEVAGGDTPSLPESRITLETSSPILLSTTCSSFIPTPANVPDRFISGLWNRGFTDGRFVFGAWGKVQLAFKTFNIPFRAIASNTDFMDLISEAISITCGEKGRGDDATYQGQDAFYKYLFGVVKGLLHNYRKDRLEAFIVDIEGASNEDLEARRLEVLEKLKFKHVDRKLLEDMVLELDLESSARIRREATKEKNIFNYFRDYLKLN
ncbi:primase C-terminal domain-containing protein [Peribacillus simplex]|uniref:primase C-terminal domain-containing protein n=1 Tax=Peribacillus simplex TaxID=1478 RepID=UPI003D2E3453